MLRLEIAAIYAGVNILLLLALAFMVVGSRRKHNIVLGDAGNDSFLRVQRAHANAAEYVPAALVGILILALLEPAAPLWLLHAAGLTLTAGRIFHGVGLNTSALNFGRRVGVALTWLSYLIIGGGLIYAGLAQQM